MLSERQNQVHHREREQLVRVDEDAVKTTCHLSSVFTEQLGELAASRPHPFLFLA